MTGTGTPTAMDVGAVRTITVCACDPWNRTGIHVAPGQEFSFRAEGNWTDHDIYTNPDGFKNAPATSGWLSRVAITLGRPFLRYRNGLYFHLIGSIGRNRKSRFAIGKGRSPWKADADGELLCFANDVPVAYGNNHGSISLEVHRIS